MAWLLMFQHRVFRLYSRFRRALNQPFALALLLCAASLLSSSRMAWAAESTDAQPVVLGWLQSIALMPSEARLTAKLDTGAKTSALHAENVKLFKRQFKEYVSFTVPVKRKKVEQDIYFELPVLRHSRVKGAARNETEERPVVEMSFCIGGQMYSAPFSLDDRSNFNYPVLLGRDFIATGFVVDPAQKFVKRYRCP